MRIKGKKKSALFANVKPMWMRRLFANDKVNITFQVYATQMNEHLVNGK